MGYIILLLAGICQGSFGLGYKRYQPLAWEAFWGYYSTLCFAIPLLWTFLIVPNFFSYITSSSMISVLVPIICGLFWGVTAIGFSKAVSYIGMSLVYGISMGISAVVGALIPYFMSDKNIKSTSFLFLLIGMIITLIGVAIVTLAGIKKEEKESKDKNSKVKLGLMLAMFSGLGSGAMNIGFEVSREITHKIQLAGGSELMSSSVAWLLVLSGGFVSNIIYCGYLMKKNKTYRTFTLIGAKKRCLMLIGTCIVWFTALIAYGTSTYYLGQMGPVVGWILFNAIALMVSNAWGIKTGEWKGKEKARKLLYLGNLVLLISWIFVGLSNR